MRWQKTFLDSKKTKKGNKECEILSGDGGLKDILQFLKEQSEKIKSLDMARKVIQNTHECSASLGDTPKSEAMGEKGAAPSTP